MKKNDIKNKLNILDNKLTALMTQYTPQRPAPYTLHTWLDKWFATYKPPTLSANYLRAVYCAIQHIKAVLPDKLLNEYTAPEIMTALYKIPLAYTRYSSYNILTDCYAQAVILGYVIYNPMDGTDRIKYTRNNGRALTLDEQRHFIELLTDNPRKPLYLFYLLSGVRCSEALSLSWSDIDYHRKQIHIHGTKTPQADRSIPLFPQINAILDEIPRGQRIIFPYTSYSVKSHFGRLKRKHGLTFRLHDLRHTFATRCIESGISIFTVSKWLGHTSINTTAKIYAHILSDFERQEVERFNPQI